MKRKSFIVFGLFIGLGILGLGKSVRAQTKVLDYGFEDWTGDANTTPNYFSSTNYQEYWTSHTTNTEVISSCSGNLPHGGSFYFHQNFYEGFDPCLGTTPTGINPHTNVGINLQYPSDPKNNLNLRTDILSNTMTIRFYFRTTGNWPNSADLGPMMKFIRVYGAGTTSAIIHISEDGTTFDIADHPAPDNSDPSWGDYHNIFAAPINWNDGEWHSISAVIEILNPDNVYPNVRYDIWWDNWDMEGSADGSADVYHPGFDSDFVHISLFVNWGARSPDSDMGIDLDDIEIWDGLANPTDITSPALFNPDNFSLQQNYPNPFNLSTTIEYTVVKKCNVQIKIYNQLGQEINILVNEHKPPGKFSIIWDGKDAEGSKLDGGVYYYRLIAGKQVSTKRMLYLR